MTRVEIEGRFDEIDKIGFGGRLDDYIFKIGKYITEKYKSPFIVKNQKLNFTKVELAEGEGCIWLKCNSQGNYEVAYIFSSTKGDDFSRNAVIAHELAHIALHDKLLPNTPEKLLTGMGEKEEVEANTFAQILLSKMVEFALNLIKLGYKLMQDDFDKEAKQT